MNQTIERRRQPHWGYIAVTLIVALILNFMPTPLSWRPWWPDWLLLTLFYWSLVLPGSWGVFLSWAVGLIEDVVSYTLLGYHAVGTAMLATIAIVANRRLRLFNLIEQAVVMFLLILAALATRFWMDRLIGQPADLSFWRTAISSALIWPFLMRLLDALDPARKRFRVHG